MVWRQRISHDCIKWQNRLKEPNGLFLLIFHITMFQAPSKDAIAEDLCNSLTKVSQSSSVGFGPEPNKLTKY